MPLPPLSRSSPPDTRSAKSSRASIHSPARTSGALRYPAVLTIRPFKKRLGNGGRPIV